MAGSAAVLRKSRAPRGAAVRKAAPVARPVRQDGWSKRFDQLMNAPISTASWILFAGVLAVVFLCALAVVYTSHESRMRLHALQQLEQQRNALQVEWGRLLLEQSSLVSQGRVETRAMTELGMSVPDESNVVIIRTP